jgi:hypothetical protein
MTKKRAAPSVQRVKTPLKPSDTTPIASDVRIRQMIEDAFLGSRNLCAAILATGKTHGPMTPEQQKAAFEYANSVLITHSAVETVTRKPPHKHPIVEWNLGK